MKRLTPAAVTLMMFAVVSLLVTAYFAKMLLAEEPLRMPLPFRGLPIVARLPESNTEVAASLPGPRQITGQIRGRTSNEPVTQEMPPQAKQPSRPIEHPPLRVSPGMRAVSVSFPQGAAVVGDLVQAGRYVDVYMTPQQNDPRFRGGVTLTLLKGIRVLATTSGDSRSKTIHAVTLELTPEQANILILAREKGSLALSYNPEGKGDGGIVLKNPDRATLDDLLGWNSVAVVPTLPDVPPVPHVPGARPVFVSESYKGSARSLYKFADGTRQEAASGKTNPPSGRNP